MRARLLVAVLLPAAAMGDRLIDLPIGRKIPFRAVRLEYRGERAFQGRNEIYVGYGIGTQFEIEARTLALGGQAERATFDLAYNLIGPISGLSPGISVGVLDVPGSTSDGTRAYAVATFREPAPLDTGDSYSEVTIGFTFGRLTSPMFGASLPLTNRIRLMGEHNGYRLAAGAEYRPIPDVSLRFLVRGQQTFLSVGVTRRF